MGLDMYLYRFPRFKWYGPEEMIAANEYFDYLEEDKAKGKTLEEWCGVKDEELPRKEDLEFFKKMRRTEYWEWDVEKRYPHTRFYEQVAYWRKANAIHRWFVDHVQDGEDDCDWHREVTQSDLEELRDVCKEVLENSVLVKGKIKNGYTINKNGGKKYNYVEGMFVANSEVCDELLPSTDGFFFGNTEYNEYYIEDVKYTLEVCNKILEETDFEKQMIYYSSSW